MTREEINEKTSLCFLLNPNIPEEEKNCVIEKVMATRATIVSKAALCNIITYILKQNAKLKKQLENRNCSNCRRSKTGCPNDGSCHNFSLWQPFINPESKEELKKEALEYLFKNYGNDHCFDSNDVVKGVAFGYNKGKDEAKEIITSLLNVFVYDMADDEMDAGHIDTKIKAEQFIKE